MRRESEATKSFQELKIFPGGSFFTIKHRYPTEVNFMDTRKDKIKYLNS